MPPELSSRAAATYGFAQEVTKQLITLCTAVFALTLTFADRIAEPGHGCRALLEAGWIFYLVSIALGIVVLMGLAGQIEEPPLKRWKGKAEPDDTIYAPAIRYPSMLQVLTFFIGLVLTFLYGWGAV